MRFVEKLLVKLFKVWMFFFCIILVAVNIEQFANKQCKFTELIFSIVLIAVFYKFGAPLLQRLLARLFKIDLVSMMTGQPQKSSKNSGIFNLSGRIIESITQPLGDWMMNLGKQSPEQIEAAQRYAEEQRQRNWNRYQANKDAAHQEWVAKKYKGTRTGTNAEYRANKLRDEAKRY